MERTETMTLGEFINELKKAKHDQKISFDFGGFHPSYIDSWRGAYDELALGFEYEGEYPTVGAIINMCMDADGSTYTGWKGGEYTMSLDTRLWVDCAGRSSETAILGLIDNGWRVIIKTGYREFT